MLNEIIINKEMSCRDRMLVEQNIIAFYRFARSRDGFSCQQQQPAQHARYDASFYQHNVPHGTDSAVIARSVATKQNSLFSTIFGLRHLICNDK
jgi:hypothetical protein